MKIKVTEYILLRSWGGNYLATFHNSRAGFDWRVTPHAQTAINFAGNPHVLSTALKLFKKPYWKVVRATMRWTEK